MPILQDLINTDKWGLNVLPKFSSMFGFLNRQPEFNINWFAGSNSDLHRVFTINAPNNDPCEAEILFEVSHYVQGTQSEGKAIFMLKFRATDASNTSNHIVVLECIAGIMPDMTSGTTSNRRIAVAISQIGMLEILVERGQPLFRSSSRLKGKILSSNLFNCTLNITDGDNIIPALSAPFVNQKLAVPRGLASVDSVGSGSYVAELTNNKNIIWSQRHLNASQQYMLRTNQTTTGSNVADVFQTLGQMANAVVIRQTTTGYDDYDTLFGTTISISLPLANTAHRLVFWKVRFHVAKTVPVSELMVQCAVGSINSGGNEYNFIDNKRIGIDVTYPDGSLLIGDWCGHTLINPALSNSMSLNVFRNNAPETYRQMWVEVICL